MATGDSGEGAASPRVILQRARPSTSRQVRSARNAKVNVVPRDSKEAGQRRVAKVRQARTVKQRRAQDALFKPIADIEIDAVIKMALRADARRSQFRQMSVLRRPSLPVSREVLAQLPVIKQDVARVAQGRQISLAKVSARTGK